MTATSLLLFAVPFGMAAAIPGPAQTTLVARVLARGGRRVWSYAAGMVIGNAVWLALAAFGLAAVATRLQPVFIAIKWAGVAYLCLLAARLWRSSGTATAPPVDDQRSSPVQSFGGGLLLTLGNPKAVVFFGAILPQVLDVGRLSITDYLQVAVVGLAIDASVQSAYALAAVKARGLFRSPARLRAVHRSAAVVLTGSAIAIASRN